MLCTFPFLGLKNFKRNQKPELVLSSVEVKFSQKYVIYLLGSKLHLYTSQASFGIFLLNNMTGVCDRVSVQRRVFMAVGCWWLAAVVPWAAAGSPALGWSLVAGCDGDSTLCTFRTQFCTLPTWKQSDTRFFYTVQYNFGSIRTCLQAHYLGDPVFSLFQLFHSLSSSVLMQIFSNFNLE